MSRRSALSFALALAGALALSLPALGGDRSRSDCDASGDEAAHCGPDVHVRVGPFGDVEVDVSDEYEDDDFDSDHFDDFTIDFDIDLFSWDDDDGESQLKILDLMLFSLVDKRSRQPDYSRLEVLDAPLITGFESRRDGEHRLTQVLDIPLFTLFRSERHPGESDLRVVDLPIIGSLFRHRVTPHKERTDVLFLFRFVRPVVTPDPPPVD